MSYTPTQWQTGDTITAEKLNNMESGIKNANEHFIVTLTPTAQDYSGVMDKTVDEIYSAYMAGQKMVFRVLFGGSAYSDIALQTVFYDGSAQYPSFEAAIVSSANSVLIHARTLTTDNGMKNTYAATIYPLTPMS